MALGIDVVWPRVVGLVQVISDGVVASCDTASVSAAPPRAAVKAAVSVTSGSATAPDSPSSPHQSAVAPSLVEDRCYSAAAAPSA